MWNRLTYCTKETPCHLPNGNTAYHIIRSSLSYSHRSSGLHQRLNTCSFQHQLNDHAVRFIKCNRIRSAFMARTFCNKTTTKTAKTTRTHHSRTFNPRLSEAYRNFGFNANPWKIALCGLLGGLCGALCGVGGGIVMLPLLRHITNMTVHQISGTSLCAVAAGALMGTANYKLSSDMTRVPIAINMALTSMAFSVLGARVNSLITGRWLSRLTGVALLACIPGILSHYDSTIPPPGHGKKKSVSDILKKHIEEEKFFQTNTYEWYTRNWHFCAFGCVAGFLSGLIGIGGGVALTAMCSRFTDLSQHEIVATSLLCIAPTALIGSLQHYRLNHVVLPVALVLGISCAVGMAIAPHVALEVSDANLKLFFSALLFVSSGRMLLV